MPYLQGVEGEASGNLRLNKTPVPALLKLSLIGHTSSNWLIWDSNTNLLGSKTSVICSTSTNYIQLRSLRG